MTKIKKSIKELDSEYSKDLENIIKEYSNDQEYQHLHLDKLLIDLLKEIGFTKVPKIWDSTDKWYA